MINANPMHWFFIEWGTIPEPENAKMLVLTLHTLNIPVIRFILRIGSLQDIFYGQPPVPNTQCGE